MYHIIKSKTIGTLVEEVNKSIARGFLPIGGIAIDSIGEQFFVQATYKDSSVSQINSKMDSLLSLTQSIVTNTDTTQLNLAAGMDKASSSDSVVGKNSKGKENGKDK